MHSSTVLVASAALSATVALWAGLGHAASFDCKKAASRVEQLICKDPDLSSLDSQLQGAYLGALDRSNTPAQVKQAQLAWLKERDGCADAACMAAAYAAQIKALSAINDEPAGCPGSTTPEVDACAAAYSRRADRELDRYVAAARKRLAEEAEDEMDSRGAKDALADLLASQAAWTAYRKAECSAVFDWWSDGTIRGAMSEECWQTVTKARIRVVWSNWLTFMDSTPPLMPDPGKS